MPFVEGQEDSIVIYSQDSIPNNQSEIKESHWKTNINYLFQLNQASFTNWVSGGQGFFAFENGLNLNTHYEKKNKIFNSTYSQTFGITWIQGDSIFRKAQDIIELHIKFSQKGKKNITSVLFVDLFTQLRPSLSPQPLGHLSNFFAPAFITEGFAFEYRSDSINLGFIFSPLAGKHTIVLDKLVDGKQFGLPTGSGVLNEVGVYFNLSLDLEVLKRTRVNTNIFLFSNYLKNFGKVDIRWDNMISVLANKWISININTNLIYNQDVLIPIYREVNGIQELVDSKPRVQFSQTLGIGVNLNSK